MNTSARNVGVQAVKELYALALAQLPIGVIIVDSRDDLALVNKVAEEVRRVAAGDVVGRSVMSCHRPESAARVKRALAHLKGADTATFTRMVQDEQSGRCYENSYTPLKDANNNYVGAALLSREITDRRKLEQERVSCVKELEDKLSALSRELQNLFVSSMASFVSVMEARDSYTAGHSLRVASMAAKMAEARYGISREVEEVEVAGKLHDIGKVGIREVVLNKPGRLTDDEFEHVKEHPVLGEKILLPN